MRNNKLIIILLILITGLMFQTSKVTIKIDRKEYNGAQEAGFASENFYACVMDALGKDEDETANDAELATIDDLVCREQNIDDVAGIEKLTNLKRLYLERNNLNELDLSHNTKLEEVAASENELISIKLPKTSTLTRVEVNKNSLASIDVSDLPNLNFLIVSANGMKELDVSSNTNLERLYSSSNFLDVIDLSKNTKLIDLDLYNNLFESIDVSKLTSLKYLNVGLNGLNSLDLSKNNALEKLYASSNNLDNVSLTNLTNLKELDIVFNKFNDFNVPDKTKIEYLVVQYGWLKDLDLTGYTNLKRLTITNHETVNVAGDSLKVSELTNRIPKELSAKNVRVYNSYSDVSMCDNGIASLPVASGGSVYVPTTGREYDEPDCDSIRIDDEEVASDAVWLLQVHASDVTIENSPLPSTVKIDYSGYYSINYIGNNDSDDGEQVINNVPDTGVTIINIILFGITIMIVGFYIISKAMQTNKIRNE